MLAKNISILYILSLFFQEFILFNSIFGLDYHAIFFTLITLMHSSVLYYIYRHNIKVIFDPMVIFSFMFFMVYYASTLYFIWNNSIVNENIAFWAYEKDVMDSMLVVCFSYLLFSFGVLFCSSIYRPISNIRMNDGKFLIKYIRFFSIFAFALIAVKLLLFIGGDYGSVNSFKVEGNMSSLLKGFFTALLVFSPICIAYLSGYYFKSNKGLYFLILFLCFELIMAFIVGNRRDLITIMFPVIVMRYLVTGYIISFKEIVIGAIFIIVYIYISTIYSYYLGSIALSGDVNYINAVVNAFSVSRSANYYFIFDAVFGWLSQIHLINSAIELYNSGVSIDTTLPIVDFIIRMIPGSNSLGLVPPTSDAEHLLFKQSLIHSGSMPYLTNPAAAESYLFGGYLYVALTSFFSGMLLIATYRFSQTSKLLYLAYISYFFLFSAGFIQSLGSLVFAYKILVLFFIVILINKALPKKFLIRRL
jgi:hypothetical protein